MLAPLYVGLPFLQIPVQRILKNVIFYSREIVFASFLFFLTNQIIGYHYDDRLARHSNMERRMAIQSERLEKLVTNLDMHYNRILDFAQSSHSFIGIPTISIGLCRVFL